MSSLNSLWLISYMSLKFGYSREVSTLINNASLGASAVGSIILGKLSTKYKRRKIFYVISSIGLMSPLYIIYCGPNAHIILIIACNVVCGFSSGVIPVEFGLIREYNDCYGCSDVASGLANSVAGILGQTALNMGMGTLMDINWTGRGGVYDDDEGTRIYSVADYDLAFSLIPVILALNWILTLIIKETKGQKVEWDQEKSFCSRYFGKRTK